MQPKPIRIILADDHEIFRDGFKSMLKKQPTVQLLGEAADGIELVALCRQLKPDVVVTDIKMPNMDGLEATKILAKNFPEIGIIALSMIDEASMIVDIIKAGANGYLLKNAHKEEIITAIKTVYNNGTYYCSDAFQKYVSHLAKNNIIKLAKPTISSRQFTDVEIEIMKCICKEMTNREIADRLTLSVRTIEGCRERIHEKTKSKNLAGVVVFAIRNNFFNLD